MSDEASRHYTRVKKNSKVKHNEKMNTQSSSKPKRFVYELKYLILHYSTLTVQRKKMVQNKQNYLLVLILIVLGVLHSRSSAVVKIATLQVVNQHNSS